MFKLVLARWFKKNRDAEQRCPRKRRHALRLESLEERNQPAYVLSTLGSFYAGTGAPSDTGGPGGLVEDSNGNLYGATTGSVDYGLMYEWVKSSGSTVVTNYFGLSGTGLGVPDGGAGQNPNGGMVADSSGNLFGTTSQGGFFGSGTLYERVKSTGAIVDLADFNGGATGNDPLTNTTGGNPLSNLVVDSSGNIYGTTSGIGGDPNSPVGTVFEYIKSSGTIVTLASFSRSTPGWPDGGGPSGNIVMDSSGNIYGTTQYGGANGDGTIFEYVKSTGSIRVLASFNGTNGEQPFSGVREDSSGLFYGTTQLGGTNNDGTVFEFNPQTGTITSLASFNGSNGEKPQGNIIMDNQGNIYGTTYIGGANNDGTVFEWVKSSGTITDLASFGSTGNGSFPNDLIADAQGDFFGMTGGAGDIPGTMFELSPTPGTITNQNSFNNGNGAAPRGGLLRGPIGNFFGTTEAGGEFGDGTLYEWNPGSGSFETLVSFDGSDGESPDSTLVEDANGNLFGTTIGGNNSDGTVFEWVASTGTLETLGTFDGTNGETPSGGLIVDGNGNLFGTTESGGTNGDGTLFEWDESTGTINTLVSFDGADGDDPTGGVLENNGIFFGTTESGGTNGDGTLFEYDPSTGILNDLVMFGGGEGTATEPGGGLIADSNNNFFGTTESGGANGDGTVFEWVNSTSTFNILTSFDGSDGASPEGSLIEDSNGNLIGTTAAGGESGDGTVFELPNSSGSITTLTSFSGLSGAQPVAGVVEDSNGNLYGTTSAGGAAGDGTVFESVDDFVTTNPNSVTINAGQSATLTAATSNPLGTDTVQWQVNTGNGNGFTDIAGATSPSLTISDTTAADNGYEYQAVFSNDAFNGTVTTNPATLTVDSVTANPTNADANAGQTATFSAATLNPLGSDSIQWQVNTGSGFSNIAGATSETLTIPVTRTGENGFEYRAVFSNPVYGGTLTTNPATLSVDSVTTNPTNATANPGQTATFTAATSNPLGTDSIQWQVNAGSGFTNIVGATSATLGVTVTASENGYEYQAVFSNSAYGGTLTTGTATLTVDSITANPTGVTANPGQTATFTAASLNPLGTDSVQWQVNTNTGNGFTNLSGDTSPTLTIDTNAAENGYEYRAVFSNASYPGSLTTSSATLTVDTVASNPTNEIANAGQAVTFSAASSNPLGTDSVQWQVNTGNGFTNLNGDTSTTLTLNNLTATENGDQYRAVFTNTAYAGSLTTSPATLTVDSVTTNPTSLTVNAGQSATLRAASSNPLSTDSVQWQVNTGNGFTNLSGETSTTLILGNVTAAENGYKYQAVFSNSAYGGTITSSPATLSVDSVTGNPNNLTVNAGQTATFSAASSNPLGTDSVQWQVNTNNGSGFTNLSGDHGTTLSLTNVTAAENGYEYQAVFSNSGYGGTLTSSPAVLTVDFAAGIVTDPKTAIVDAGANTSFSATASGNPAPTVQWQVSTNGGSTYSNLSDGAVYSGTNSDTLNLTDVTASMSMDKYRAVFSNTLNGANTASTATTAPATVEVANPATSTVSVANSSVQSGSSIKVTLQAKDINGINVALSGLTVAFSLNNLSGGQGTFSAVTDNGNGTYTASFTGTLAGANSITATVNGKAISTSPAAITVTPGSYSLSTSVVKISLPSVQLGGVATVTLQAKDAAGNNLTTGGLAVMLSLAGSPAAGKLSGVTDNHNGTYTATFTGTADGSNSIVASIGGNSVSTAPASISVTKDAVSLVRSTESSGPIEITSGNSTTITLLAKDAAGTPEVSGGLKVTFKLASTTGGQGTFGPVVDNQNGTYSVTFTGTIAGKNTIKAYIGGKAVTSTAATIQVTDGPLSVTRSTLSVSAKTVKAGTIVTVTLQPEDAAGNKLILSPSAVVQFSIGSGQQPAITVTANKNGTYTAKFTATAAGVDAITATINGQTLAAAPSLQVTPKSASPATSFVMTPSPGTVAVGSTVSITLQAVDAYDNKETTGGLSVAFKLGQGAGKGTFGAVKDNRNGTYTVTFKGTVAGSNTIEAFIDGLEVETAKPTITVT